MFAAAENLNLITKDNDGTDNLLEDCWKSILGLSDSKTIQVKINTNIKKEKIKDNSNSNADNDLTK